MRRPTVFACLICALPLLWPQQSAAADIVVEGAPADTGFNVGSIATIRATLRGFSGEASRYAVFAEIQYAGTTSTTSVQMDRTGESRPGEARYEIGWPIPPEAPTGLYTVTARVEDRTAHRTVATKNFRPFTAYKKLLRVSGLAIDKTFYNVGEPIRAELTLQNLSDHGLKDVRVEFSNANYPWISLYAPGSPENINLAVKVIGEHLDVPAHGEVRIPMVTAGTAAFLQGIEGQMLGAGGPERHAKVPPPEVDTYTVAVWNAERTTLYDMQFTTPAIVRASDRELPIPYSRSFTHPYNSDIDFKAYREFYPPGLISPAIAVDTSHTLYRPGDQVRIIATLKNPGGQAWPNAELRAIIRDSEGSEVRKTTLISGVTLKPGEKQAVAADAWTIPASQPPGNYTVDLSLTSGEDKLLAKAATEIAVNNLPASILVFCPHEDDEHAYAGLIRAAAEAQIPVHVVIFTGGDVGACERYYDKPCGPNEAREFGMVRMEESAESLEHIGLTRDRLSILGLPDGGSGDIWSRNIHASNPFMSIYLACDHAPYENVVQPNLSFARDPVIELVKQFITKFHPALIATPHPDERHVDHRTTNWFVLKACQELLRDKQMDPQTIVLADEAYGAGNFKPAPYKYEKEVIYLSGEAAALKQEMSWLYQSQDGNLAEGMKRPYHELPRQERHLRIVDWQQHEGWNE